MQLSIALILLHIYETSPETLNARSVGGEVLIDVKQLSIALIGIPIIP